MTRAIVALGSLSLTTAVVVALMSLGRLTLDVGWGRRVRSLSPLFVRIGAPRETGFDVIALPYLSANPPAELILGTRGISEPTGRLELPTGGLRNRCSTG